MMASKSITWFAITLVLTTTATLRAENESGVDGESLVNENCFSCHRTDDPHYPDHTFGWVYRRSYSKEKWSENVDRMSQYAVKGGYIEEPWTPEQRQAMVDFLVEQTNDKRTPLEEIGMSHFAVVHFPIALLIAVGLVDFVGLLARWPVKRDVTHTILALAVLSSFAAVGLGMTLIWGMPGMSEDLTDHRNAGFATAIFATLAFILRESRVRACWAILRVAYVAVLFLAVASASAAGHLGGMVVHGEYDALSAMKHASEPASAESK